MADLQENWTVVGEGGVKEISPDLLKNTPSNIRKLEDEIEHLKGRQKYHAQTRSPSDGGDVRWYYCKVPLAENELAASVPRTEIVGKSEYFRFGMRDSLAIEASFLQREEELLSSWWREYAECSEGPRVRASSTKKSDSKVDESSFERSSSAKLCQDEEERVGVPVKGGLYEVDLAKRHSFPVYWHGENRRVLRGHWFARKGGLDWLPIREDVAEQLEGAYRTQVWHRRTFQPSGLFAARVDLQGYTPGLHALFTGEDDTWEAWLDADASGFSSVISFGGNGIKLRRGYSASNSPKPTQDELRQRKEEEMDDYCSQVPVRHLVFMVHGIGQRLEKSNLVDDVANFRHITATLSEKHLTSDQRDSQRVLYIPCQWRKGLKLSGESAVDKITLDGVKGLRVMLSATVHDVLYYMSPIYCQDIINSVSNQLNRLYLKFLKRNPGYDGKVSIYGHSLGSVLSYDILCHQEKLSSPFPMDWMYKEHSKDDEPSPEINNQSIKSDVPNTLDMNETKGIMDHVEGETMVTNSDAFKHEGGHGEIFSANTGPIMSELDPMTSMNGSMDLLQTSNEGDAHQLVHDFCHIPPQEEEGASGESESVDCSASASGSEKIAEAEHNNSSEKEEAIKLREEIEYLRAKIAELESQVKYEDAGNEAIATTPLAPASQKNECQLRPEPDNSLKSYTPLIRYTKLEFKVDTFFAVGSPLGVFLSLRNIRLGIGKGKDYWDEENIIEEMPACHRMLNIFHPYDPVAYRIEPLVCKEYIEKRPVIVPYHKGGKRLHIGLQEFSEDLAARSQAIRDQFNSVRAKVLTVCQSNADDIEDAVESSEGKEERTYGSIMMERLTGSEKGRIDHMLQDKTFEHHYLQAIGAHTNYWRDYDTALFILKHLYGVTPEDSNSTGESNRGSLKAETAPTSFSDPVESIDENLPLTSSVKTTLVRSFSSRASKFWKKT